MPKNSKAASTQARATYNVMVKMAEADRAIAIASHKTNAGPTKKSPTRR